MRSRSQNPRDVLIGFIWGVLLSLSSRLSGAAPEAWQGGGILFELFAFRMSRVPFALQLPFRSVPYCCFVGILSVGRPD